MWRDRYVTVKTVHGSKITQRGRLPPESLARIMLRELADEGKA
jgi:ribosomal protein S25